MGLSSLLSCCSSNKPSEKTSVDSDNRTARIVSISRPGDVTGTERRSHFEQSQNRAILSPPAYHEIGRDVRLEGAVAATSDAKPSSNEPTLLNARNDFRTERNSVSDRSSMISIPSTRLSGITSTYTDGTCVQSHGTSISRTLVERGWRSSFYAASHNTDGTSSPPPSYQEQGDAEYTHHQTGSTYPGDAATNSSVLRPQVSNRDSFDHPVMQDGWLEHLQNMALERQRVRPGQLG